MLSFFNALKVETKIMFREAIKSHNRFNLGKRPNTGGGVVGCGLEDGFPTSYFCYYNPTSAFLKCVRYYRALNCSDMVVFRALKYSQYGRF